LTSGVLQFLSSAEAKYRKITQWEAGSPVFRKAGAGDPLTIWANRRLPYGLHADQFDEEGLPAQRLLLIEDNKLANYWAKKRYAEYLSLPATGSFGDIELPPGPAPEASLRAGPYAEIARFSWFDPDVVTGDFASEIRLGYLVDGDQRTPFRGGMLVGNVLDALAEAHWSSETGFYGSYQGPVAVRLEGLKITAG
jgi:PmbA protein